jgi:hypothetical protein
MSWDKPATTTTDEAQTDDNEAGMSQDEKNVRRKEREQTKHNCLLIAHHSDHSPDDVITRAKAYYSFITGKKIRS